MSLKLLSLSPGKFACKNWSRGRFECLRVESEEVEGWDGSEMGGTGESGWVGDEELVVTEVKFVGSVESELGKTAGVELVEGAENELVAPPGEGLMEWVGLAGVEVGGRDMGVLDTEEENNSAGGTHVSMAVKGRGLVEEEDRVAGKVECMESCDSESSKLQEETSISGAVVSGKGVKC